MNILKFQKIWNKMQSHEKVITVVVLVSIIPVMVIPYLFIKLWETLGWESDTNFYGDRM